VQQSRLETKIPTELKEKAEKTAESLYLTLSQFTRDAIKEKIERVKNV